MWIALFRRFLYLNSPPVRLSRLQIADDFGELPPSSFKMSFLSLPNCSGTGMRALGEFEVHSSCAIPASVEDALRLAGSVLGGVVFLAQVLAWFARGKFLVHQPRASLALLIFLPFETALTVARPLGGLLDPRLRIASSLGWAIGVHIFAGLGVCTAAAFAYIKAGVLERASLGRHRQRGSSFFIRRKGAILLSISLIQGVLLLTFAPLAYFFPASFSPRIAFWLPIIFVLFTLLPFFLILGALLLFRLRHSQRRRRTLERQLAIVITLMGLILLVAAPLAFIEVAGVASGVDYILIELLWILCMGFEVSLLPFSLLPLFQGAVFFLLARKAFKRRLPAVSSKSPTPPPTTEAPTSQSTSIPSTKSSREAQEEDTAAPFSARTSAPQGPPSSSPESQDSG